MALVGKCKQRGNQTEERASSRLDGSGRGGERASGDRGTRGGGRVRAGRRRRGRWGARLGRRGRGRRRGCARGGGVADVGGGVVELEALIEDRVGDEIAVEDAVGGVGAIRARIVALKTDEGTIRNGRRIHADDESVPAVVRSDARAVGGVVYAGECVASDVVGRAVEVEATVGDLRGDGYEELSVALDLEAYRRCRQAGSKRRCPVERCR